MFEQQPQSRKLNHPRTSKSLASAGGRRGLQLTRSSDRQFDSNMIEHKTVYTNSGMAVNMLSTTLLVTIIAATASGLTQATLMPRYQMTHYGPLRSNNDNVIGKLSDDSTGQAQLYHHYQVAENDLQMPEPRKEQSTSGNTPSISGENQQQQQQHSSNVVADRTVINGNHATYVEPPADFKPIIYESVHSPSSLAANTNQLQQADSVFVLDSESFESPNQLPIQSSNNNNNNQRPASSSNSQPYQIAQHQHHNSRHHPPRPTGPDSAVSPSSTTTLLLATGGQPMLSSSGASNRPSIQQHAAAGWPESSGSNENDASVNVNVFGDKDNDGSRESAGGEQAGGQQQALDSTVAGSQLKAPIGRWSDWHDISFEPDLASSDSHLSQSSAPSALPIGSPVSPVASPVAPSPVSAASASSAAESSSPTSGLASSGAAPAPREAGSSQPSPISAGHHHHHQQQQQQHRVSYGLAGWPAQAGGMAPPATSQGAGLMLVLDPYQGQPWLRGPPAFGPMIMMLMGDRTGRGSQQAVVAGATPTGRQLTGAATATAPLVAPQPPQPPRPQLQPQQATRRQLASYPEPQGGHNYATFGGSGMAFEPLVAAGGPSGPVGRRLKSRPLAERRASQEPVHWPRVKLEPASSSRLKDEQGEHLSKISALNYQRRHNSTGDERLRGIFEHPRRRRNLRPLNAEVHIRQQQRQQPSLVGQLVLAQPGQLQLARFEPEQQQQQHRLHNHPGRQTNQAPKQAPVAIVRRQTPPTSVAHQPTNSTVPLASNNATAANATTTTTGGKRPLSSSSSYKGKQRPNLRTQLPVGLSSWILGGIRDLDGRHWRLPADLMSKLAINDVDLNHHSAGAEQPEVATSPPQLAATGSLTSTLGPSTNQRVPR